MMHEYGVPPGVAPDPMMMAGGAPPMDMGVPPSPDMGMPPEGMAPEMGPVPPAPGDMLGAEPMQPPITVPGWIPADPEIPVDEMTCAEIGAVPYQDKDGKPFCMVAPPEASGEMMMPPPGAMPPPPI